jgi:ABC-2 type transport system permease protein
LKIPKSRMLAIARKEFLHIIHDPRSLLIIFAMPIIQLVMFGYALDMEIKNVDLAVIDYDHSIQSRHLIEQFEGSEFFNVASYNGSIDNMEQLFLERKAKAVLIINQDFAQGFQRNIATPIQIIIDASDPNAGTLIKNYCSQVVNAFNQKYTSKPSLPLEVESTIWFNPDLKSAFFFVPGLLALLLIMICALLTSITVTREKEMGTMEQILVSPVKANEIIIGKVLPYIGISILVGALILVIGIILFGVPFNGSYTLLFFLSTLYIITALSLGLMISTIASTQQVAMMIALISTLLPTVFLSGFIFPLSAMPEILQIISNIVPAKYYLMIVRGVLIKGNTFFQLIEPTAILVLMTFLLLIIALRRFKGNLET